MKVRDAIFPTEAIVGILLQLEVVIVNTNTRLYPARSRFQGNCLMTLPLVRLAVFDRKHNCSEINNAIRSGY